MDKLVNKTVKLDLVGLNGNAYNLMGHFQRAASNQGWTKSEIEKVLKEAMSSDYNHLVATLQTYCTEE